MKIKEIFLIKGSSEQSKAEKENADVIVTMENGDKYIASFFAYDSILPIRDTHIETGDFLNGKYFWMKNMLLIDSCLHDNVKNVIEHLIDEGDFKDAFKLINA